jgi:hypothetical protein
MRSLLTLTLLLSGLVAAKGGSDKGAGKYTVTVNGQTYNQDKGKVKNVPCRGTVTVRGLNNRFDIDCATLNLYNYAFTGASNNGSKKHASKHICISRC